MSGGAHIEASAPHWTTTPPEPGDLVTARIRYHATDVPTRILEITADRLTLDTPARAIAPGPAVVLYRGTEVLGGATIEGTRR